MKKLTALSIVLLSLTGLLFAQDAEAPTFTVQGRVDMWWMPLQAITKSDDVTNDGSKTVLGAGLGRDTNGGAGIRGRLFVEGKTSDIGLKLQLQFFPTETDGNRIGFDDNVEIWWKPIDILKIDAGKFVEDSLRGKIGDNWMKSLTVQQYDADEIFSRFKSNGLNNGGSGNGGVLATVNTSGLVVGLLMPNLHAFGAGATSSALPKDGVYETVPTDGSDGTNEIGHVYEKVQVAVGYNIDGVGLVRAQYVGATPTSNNVAPRFELAFAYTGMSGLVLDIGGKLPLPINEKSVKTWSQADLQWKDGSGAEWKYQAPYQVSLGASYALDDITIVGRVDAKFLGKVTSGGIDTEVGPQINAHLWPTYNLGFMTAGLDVGLAWMGKTKYDGKEIDDSDGMRVGFGLFGQKAFGSSWIRGGLAYRVPSKVAGFKEDGVFSIPIVFESTF